MSVWFEKSRRKWRYNFIRAGQRHSNNCVDPDTGEDAANKTDAKRIEKKIIVQVEDQIAKAGGAEAVSAKKRAEEQAKAPYVLIEALNALATRKQGTANWGNTAAYIRELATFFGPVTDVRDVTDQRVWDYISWSRQQPVMVYMGAGVSKAEAIAKGKDLSKLYRPAKDGRTRSDSTINRYLDCLREALRIAYELRDPKTGEMMFKRAMPKVPDLDEPERLPRPISDDDIWAAVERAPAHLAWAILLTRLMGFRKAEVFGLTVQQVDFQNRGIWLAAEVTKGNRDEFIPAGAEAMELLEYLAAEAMARGTDYLITYRTVRRTWNIKGGAGVGRGPADGNTGKIGNRIAFGPARPVKDVKTSWGKVLAALGLKGVHKFHNTKASFVTAIAQAAAPAVTQQLARHKDYRTTERYLKVNDMAARAAVEGIAIKLSRSRRPERKEKG